MVRSLFVIFLINHALGQSSFDYSKLSASQKKCYDKVLDESKKLVIESPTYIEQQARLTALKLALKTLSRKGLKSQTLESYANSIVGNKTLEKIEEYSKIKSDVDKYLIDSSIDKATLVKDIIEIKSKDHISDKDALRLMMGLQESWKGSDDFGFDKADYAIASYLGRVSDGYLLSNYVHDVLMDLKFDQNGIETKRSDIIKNIKIANDKLRAEVFKLASRSHNKFKEECVIDEENGVKTQINSVLNLTCKEKTEDLFSNALLDSFKHLNDQIIIDFELPKKESIAKLNDIQDDLNKKSDLEKIIGFHKNKFQTEDCHGYAVVDKEKSLLQAYTNEGDLVLEDRVLVGDSNREDKKKFNPDSRLRRFGNGSYTRTTGAGIYYTKKDVKNRKERKYDKEFSDRVIALSFKDKDGQLKEEKTLAVHSVPNVGWVKNRDLRLDSLDDQSMDSKLTTGCVNISGVTYDLLNQYLGNKCPIYILPEDKKNHFFIKNNELIFTTKDKVKRLGLEHSKKIVDGELVDDENNYSIVNYSQSSKEIKFSKVKNYESEKINSFIDQVKKESLIGHDDLLDITSIYIALEKSGEQKSLEQIKSSYEEASKIKDYNYLNSSERRKFILNGLDGIDIDLDLVISSSKEVLFE